MDKKEMKFYEAPACEVVEMKITQALLDGSNQEKAEDPDEESEF